MKLNELINEAEEISTGDFIISKFEAGNLTYQQAKDELLKHGEEVWIQELNMAAELMKDAGTTYH